MSKSIRCSGCLLESNPTHGPTHAYLESSPECWRQYGEILAKEYEDSRYMKVHSLTVDSYALQHSGKKSNQTIQSANIHLASLFAYFKLGVQLESLLQIKKEITVFKHQFDWLVPPANMSRITVSDVLKCESPEEHAKVVNEWAYYIFQSWKSHHGKVASYIKKIHNKSAHTTPASAPR
ncbi:MAG: DUF5946 family protein [Opitutales bacterium]|nr:DUF5946 family protein [Opitutales bacterium]